MDQRALATGANTNPRTTCKSVVRAIRIDEDGASVLSHLSVLVKPMIGVRMLLVTMPPARWREGVTANNAFD